MRHSLSGIISMRLMAGIAVTALAAAAFWFWAMGMSGSFLYSTHETQAEVIRRYFPHRIVQPEWLGNTVTLESWMLTEEKTRILIIVVIWTFTIAFIVFKQPRKLIHPN